MPFTPQTFVQLIELLATQYGAQASLPANTNIGSSLGAVFNAVSLLGMNIQNELAFVQTISRMLSSSGSDLDTWGAQFNIPRLPATASTGTISYTTAKPVSAQLIIPVGGVVQTQGGLQFEVIAPLSPADPNYSQYNVVLGGYVIQVGTSTGSATVQCLSNGTVGNVAANTITTPGSTGTSPLINGLNSITNAAAFTNGTGAELDPAYQARMTLTLSTGAVATANALAAAILKTQPGLTYSIGDGLSSSGSPQVGNVSVYVNENGTGTAAPGPLVSAVQANVSGVRAAGITATVYAPTILPVDVFATVTVQATSTVSVTQALANITVLIQEYLNNIGLNPTGGNTICEISQLYVIMRTYPNVTNVTGVQQKLHSASSPQGTDLIATFGQQFVSSGIITLTPGS